MYWSSPTKTAVKRCVFNKDTDGDFQIPGPCSRHILSRKAGGTAWLLDQRGLGTLEIVILIAVLLAVALLFNDQIRQFADKLFKAVFNDGKVIQKLN